MVFALSVPVCINQTISQSSRGSWPIAQCRVDLVGRRVMIRCSLSMPGRCSMPGSPTSSRGLWFGPSSLVYKEFFRSAWSTMLHNHKVWSEKSLQTLQRVGTLLRSTSKDCIAALASKKGSAKKPTPDPNQPPESEPPSAGQLKASLSRFITTASNTELQQAAMLADLSNLAYDVSAIDHQLLQERHGLTVVAHSRPQGALNVEAKAVVPAALEAQTATQPQVLTPSEAVVPVISPASAAANFNAGEDYAYSGAVSAASPVWDAAAQPPRASPRSTSSSNLVTRSPPASPRTPLVLSSLGDLDDLTPSNSDLRFATAAAAVADPDTPKRKTSALAAAAGAASASKNSSSRAVAPAAVAVAEPVIVPSGSPSAGYGSSAAAGAVLAGQLMQYQQHDLFEAVQQQHGVDLEQKEQEALAFLQQQEQAILLEMQQQQQLQMLLQQEQAIMQQLQQQGSNEAGSTPASSTAWWWWWQQQQQQQQAVPSAHPTSKADSQAELHPTDWFVCDEAAPAEADSPTRYFAIQGSITLDHWRINLTIDPCEFEGGALGHVKVHRGVYEAALQMLDTFVPYVQQHLARHPNGKIAFTGHSLGGSLATLLMLLLVHRGILPAANVATVRTFGAPAIFCEGATGCPPAAGACQSCSLPCQHRAEHIAASSTAGSTEEHDQGAGSLLGRLGLSPESVVNVVMTRDIVPRAFVCDYTLVADVLKSWLPSFKEHVGLASCRDHKALYNFIGTVEVLQPSLECPFVLPDEAYSMLPEQPALYKLTEPCCHLPGASEDTATALVVDAPAAAAASMLSTATEESAETTQLDDKVAAFRQLEGLVVAACASCSRSSCSGCSAGAMTDVQDSDVLQSVTGSVNTEVPETGFAAEDGSITADSVSVSSESDADGKVPKKSMLHGFGSWGSLVSLGHLSLTTAIAELTSTFTVVSSNSGMVNVSTEASATADTPNLQQAATVLADAFQTSEAVSAAHAAAVAKEHSDMQAPLASAAGSSDVLGMTLGDAILTFMNSPHPLETLGEMRAYGPAGTISRFHNPYNYTVALQQLCKPAKQLSE